MPYLGLGCEGAVGPVQVQGHVLYSPWVSAEDEDHHFRGAREYEGDFSGGSWFGAAISAHWFFAPQWYATMSVEYEKYDEIIGDVTLATPEGRWTYQDSAGVEMETVLLLLGAGFRF
jgi:outer membrane protease